MSGGDTGPAAPASALDTLRRRGVQAWALIGWISLALLLIGNMVLGTRVGFPLLAIGGAMNVAPTYVALRGRHDAEARALMGSLAAVIPAMMVFLLKGHPWQMDAHMYFFVGLAALVMLADWRPIILASVLTAVHHVTLEWLAPEWVFSGSGNVDRVVFHVVAVGLQCGALVFLTIRLERLFASQAIAMRRAQELAETAEHGQSQAERAMLQARAAEAEAAHERRQREDQAERAAAERHGELMTLAQEFERSVTSVVKISGQATERLEQAALRLEEVTGGANREADEVVAGSGRATSEIAHVAASIGNLSHSIRTIAAAANRQSELTDTASGEARRSVETVAMLEEHAVQIESLLDDIRKITNQTNLLALNATIEAARAGDSGRAFAVVAGEVKTLSADTKRTSDRISALIAGIRDGVVQTGTELRSVNGAIGEVAAAALGIASTVDEHGSAARQVDRATDVVVATWDDVERRIGSVAKSVSSASALAATVRSSATDLALSARELRSSTDMFVSFIQTDRVLEA